MNEPLPSAATAKAKPPNNASLRDRDEHLDALKRLASQLAHDFNNFLAPALGYATLIKEEVQPESPILKYATSLESAARKSEGSIEKILGSVRPQRRFRPANSELHDLVAEEIKTWNEALSTTSQVKVSQHLEPCPIQLDQHHWRSVVRELLRNARLSLATGGEIEITLRAVKMTPERVDELGLAAPDVACLTVRDTGFGMSPEIQRHAFDPFFTTRPKGHGMGLGLTLVHGVARAHGGQVTLESEEDRGTTVTIWVPFLNYHDRSVEKVPTTPTVGRKSTGSKILLVDDDPAVLEVVKACLLKIGYDVFTGKDGTEGLKWHRQHAAELALVISDVTMPNMNGVEMLLEIRKTSPNLPAIMISGDTDTYLSGLMAAFGDNPPPLMKKPFTLKGLVAMVKKHI